jgi:UDP-N-acetylglucosamine 2-epimerase (non-hydrolysing)
LHYKVIIVVGARPNFIKAAPVFQQMKKYKAITPFLVHTGQHYDASLSKVFFKDLRLPRPTHYLGVGSGTHSVQTAGVMTAFEKILQEKNPDLVVVVGDVNSTLAAAVTAVKFRTTNDRFRPFVAHVEAGLRSFDDCMPEEINRRITDAVSDLLFTTEASANDNLIRAGIDQKKIFFVGNVMIDSLLRFRKQAERSNVLTRLGLRPKDYAVLTMHRPSNVDQVKTLKRIFGALKLLANDVDIVFPIHPRARLMMQKHRLNADLVKIVPPLGYVDFLKLMSRARYVLTDSGGIQEETTFLGIPCLTLRENTERPVTVQRGTNTLVGADPDKIVEAANRAMHGGSGPVSAPQFWDGKAAVRICKIIHDFLRTRC